MSAPAFPRLDLIQRRREANVAFVRKQRIVIRKLRAARPEVPPEVWTLVQQSAGDLFMHTWDAKLRALERALHLPPLHPAPTAHAQTAQTAPTQTAS